MKLFDLIEAEKALRALVYGNVNDADQMRDLQMKAVSSMVKLTVEIITHSTKEIPIEVSDLS
jgi:hypothetical protein